MGKIRKRKMRPSEIHGPYSQPHLMLERKIESEEGISDTKIVKRRKRRIEVDRQTIQEAGRKENPRVNKPYKAVQRSFQFLRWLRHSMLVKTSWRPAIDDLRPLMAAYLS